MTPTDRTWPEALLPGERRGRAPTRGRPLVLIGPAGVGKTTLCHRLAALTGRPRVHLDALFWTLYREHPAVRAVETPALTRAYVRRDEVDPRHARPYRAAVTARLEATHGPAVTREISLAARAHVVARVLERHADSGALLDFGAGHSIHEGAANQAAVRVALSRAHAVVLLLPCADRARALLLLKQRLTGAGRPFLRDAALRYLTHPFAREIATHELHVDGQTVEDTVGRLRAVLDAADPRRGA